MLVIYGYFKRDNVKVLKNSRGHYAKFEVIIEEFCKNRKSLYEHSDDILKKKTPLTKVPFLENEH